MSCDICNGTKYIVGIEGQHSMAGLKRELSSMRVPLVGGLVHYSYEYGIDRCDAKTRDLWHKDTSISIANFILNKEYQGCNVCVSCRGRLRKSVTHSLKRIVEKEECLIPSVVCFPQPYIIVKKEYGRKKEIHYPSEIVFDDAIEKYRQDALIEYDKIKGEDSMLARELRYQYYKYGFRKIMKYKKYNGRSEENIFTELGKKYENYLGSKEIYGFKLFFEGEKCMSLKSKQDKVKYHTESELFKKEIKIITKSLKIITSAVNVSFIGGTMKILRRSIAS